MDVFEWDEAKRLINLDKHTIDFRDAKEIWQDDVLEVSSPQQEHDEQRYLAYGLLKGRVIAVVYTWGTGGDGLSGLGGHATMSEKRTTMRLGEGGEGATDWERVDALPDEDMAKAITEDVDTFEPGPEWLAHTMVLRPAQPKTRVTAYFDKEVVDWFRAQGWGYQTRMNAVLRAYMESVRKHQDSSTSS